MSFRALTAFHACTLTLVLASAAPVLGQAGDMGMPQGGSNRPMPSPPATATVSLAGQNLTIKYNAPSLRGRHLGGPEIVPYNQIWRTGSTLR